MKLLALSLMSLSLCAQQVVPSIPRTVVSDTMKDLSGQVLAGDITLTLNDPQYIFVRRVPATAGVFSVSLYPGTYSVVIHSSTFGIDRSENWVVPNSGSVQTLSDVGSPSANITGGGSGTFVTLSGDASSTSTGGATVVNGLKGVPFCTGYTPTNGQFVEYTTGGSPNPCYTAAAGGGSVTVMADGSVVGSTGALNYSSGTGIYQIISAGSGQINIQTVVDTAVVQTQAGEQGGTALQCASASGSGATYTCSLNPTLDSYTSGMVLHWVPDHNGTGGVTTLNVDTLGTVAVKLPDGSSDPSSSSIVAGEMYPVWYDGTVFRLPVAVSSGGGGGGLSATCTWSTLEAGSCGAGSLTAVMTWAQIEAL